MITINDGLIWHCKHNNLGCDYAPVTWIYFTFVFGVSVGLLIFYLILKSSEKRGGKN